MVLRPEVWHQSAGVIRIAQNRLEIDHGIKRATAPYEVQAELASKIQARARERGVAQQHEKAELQSLLYELPGSRVHERQVQAYLRR